MRIIEINTTPTPRDLSWFGIVVLAFFGLVGLMAWRWTGTFSVSFYLWTLAAVLVSAYYAIPTLQRPMFVGWMYATYPLGWVMSHLLMAVVFFGVLTPTGLLMRAVRRDTMDRTFDRNARTYWKRRAQVKDPARYFRQF